MKHHNTQHNSHLNLPSPGFPEEVFSPLFGAFLSHFYSICRGVFSVPVVSHSYHGCSNLIHTQNPLPNGVGVLAAAQASWKLKFVLMLDSY